MPFRRWSPGSAAWPPSRVRLFLFDIDGTLVTVRGAGRAAFARALEETYGTAGTIDRYDFRGRTDLRIVHDLMTEAVGGARRGPGRGHGGCWAPLVALRRRRVDGGRLP